MIELIGIYQVDNFEGVHLIELKANVPADKFDVGKITQEKVELPSDSWQTPWDERYLDESGQMIIGDFNSVPLRSSSTRLLFLFSLSELWKPTNDSIRGATFISANKVTWPANWTCIIRKPN